MHSLHTNRAVPHALESALLLSSAGLGALEAEALGTRPAEWRRGIAERKASVVEEAETHARRRHCVWLVDEEGERRGSKSRSRSSWFPKGWGCEGRRAESAGESDQRVFRRVS
jgi:hypothetical protein